MYRTNIHNYWRRWLLFRHEKLQLQLYLSPLVIIFWYPDNSTNLQHPAVYVKTIPSCGHQSSKNSDDCYGISPKNIYACVILQRTSPNFFITLPGTRNIRTVRCRRYNMRKMPRCMGLLSQHRSVLSSVGTRRALNPPQPRKYHKTLTIQTCRLQCNYTRLVAAHYTDACSIIIKGIHSIATSQNRIRTSNSNRYIRQTTMYLSIGRPKHFRRQIFELWKLFEADVDRVYSIQRVEGQTRTSVHPQWGFQKLRRYDRVTHVAKWGHTLEPPLTRKV